MHPQSHPIIAIKIPFGWHYAIQATDYWGSRTLISFRGKKDQITEDPWAEVVGNSAWRYATEIQPHLGYRDMLNRARSAVGLSGYKLSKRNCEHFARWAAGLKVESKQVQKAVISASILAAFGGLFMLARK